jgi:hypothetical protein
MSAILALLVYLFHPGMLEFTGDKNLAYLCWVHADSAHDSALFFFIYSPLAIVYGYSFYIFLRLSLIFRYGGIPVTFSHRIGPLYIGKAMLGIFSVYNLGVVGLGIMTHFRGSYWEPFKYLLSSKGFCCLIVYLLIEIEKPPFSEEIEQSNSAPILHEILQKSVVLATSRGIQKSIHAASEQDFIDEQDWTTFLEHPEMMVTRKGIITVLSGSKTNLLPYVIETIGEIETSNPDGEGPMSVDLEPTSTCQNPIRALSTALSPDRRSKKISKFKDLLSIPLMINFQTSIEFVEYCPSKFRSIRKLFGVQKEYERL